MRAVLRGAAVAAMLAPVLTLSASAATADTFEQRTSSAGANGAETSYVMSGTTDAGAAYFVEGTSMAGADGAFTSRIVSTAGE